MIILRDTKLIYLSLCPFYEFDVPTQGDRFNNELFWSPSSGEFVEWPLQETRLITRHLWSWSFLLLWLLSWHFSEQLQVSPRGDLKFTMETLRGTSLIFLSLSILWIHRVATKRDTFDEEHLWSSSCLLGVPFIFHESSEVAAWFDAPDEEYLWRSSLSSGWGPSAVLLEDLLLTFEAFGEQLNESRGFHMEWCAVFFFCTDVKKSHHWVQSYALGLR